MRGFIYKIRLTIGSEKMVKYLCKSQLSSSWSTPFRFEKSPNILMNKSDINLKMDLFVIIINLVCLEILG